MTGTARATTKLKSLGEVSTEARFQDDVLDIPLRSSSKRDIQPPKTRSRDLGDVNPAYGTPAELESSCKQINSNKGDVPGSADRRAIFGRTKADVETEVEHHDRHHGSGPDEGEFAAEGVDEEDEEEEAGDHLDYAVDARGEEGVGVAGDAEVGEDLGRLFGIGISNDDGDSFEVLSGQVLHNS